MASSKRGQPRFDGESGFVRNTAKSPSGKHKVMQFPRRGTRQHSLSDSSDESRVPGESRIGSRVLASPKYQHEISARSWSLARSRPRESCLSLDSFHW